MNLAQCLALFLSFYRWKVGEGQELIFPGSDKAWKAKHSDTHQDILARFHIFASLHPDRVKERAFNVADGYVVTWESVWPGICQWFGLKGVGPNEGNTEESGVRWLRSKQDEWGTWEKEYGLREGMLANTRLEFMEGIIGKIEFDREYDLSRCREAGFKEKMDTVAGYHLAFDRMRKAKIIP